MFREENLFYENKNTKIKINEVKTLIKIKKNNYYKKFSPSQKSPKYPLKTVVVIQTSIASTCQGKENK